MVKTGTKRRILARIAAAVAAISVLLAATSWLIGRGLLISTTGYFSIATVALLFAIYCVVDGWADAAKKDK